MKKSVSILLLFLFVCKLPCFAIPDTTTLAKLDSSVKAVEKSVSEVNTKVVALDSNVKAVHDTGKNILTGWIPVDTTELNYVKKNAKTVLYGNSVFHKKVQQPVLTYTTTFISLGLLILLWLIAANLLVNAAICKDESFDANLQLVAAKNSPYSYSRVQLFWWTMIILSCYIFFYGITGVLLPLNGTSVILLGCGLLVHAIGKTVDNRQIATSKGLRNQDNNKLPIEPDFFNDILSDDSGISIHRFQSMVFNVVFGIGFIGYFIKQVTLESYPLADFTEWQFALIGISSATYLGLKATENNASVTTSNQRTQGAANDAAVNAVAQTGEVSATKAINKF